MDPSRENFVQCVRHIIYTAQSAKYSNFIKIYCDITQLTENLAHTNEDIKYFWEKLIKILEKHFIDDIKKPILEILKKYRPKHLD